MGFVSAIIILYVSALVADPHWLNWSMQLHVRDLAETRSWDDRQRLSMWVAMLLYEAWSLLTRLKSVSLLVFSLRKSQANKLLYALLICTQSSVVAYALRNRQDTGQYRITIASPLLIDSGLELNLS